MVNRRRKAVESLYLGRCNVYEFKDVKNPITKVTEKVEVLLLDDVKCKLSFERIAVSAQGEIPATVAQATKLFVAPELVLPSGCKVVVAQNGVTNTYQLSGFPAVFMDHQEIMLEVFTGYRGYS